MWAVVPSSCARFLQWFFLRLWGWIGNTFPTMTDHIDIKESGNLLEVAITGKLTREFYQAFAPRVDSLIQAHGRIRILVVMHDFHGWTLGALWEDMKFDCAHWKDIERLAIVGESKWEQGMATFCKPFTKATIQYFDQSKLADARQWIVS